MYFHMYIYIHLPSVSDVIQFEGREEFRGVIQVLKFIYKVFQFRFNYNCITPNNMSTINLGIIICINLHSI